MTSATATRLVLLVATLMVIGPASVAAQLAENSPKATFIPAQFKYSPGPADNPLKGLVPYQGPHDGRFPYSMEFSYLPLSALVKGPEQYDWQPLEILLDDIASRGRQTVTRVFLEYPGKENVIPPFLVKGGLKVYKYQNTNTAPLPPAKIETPNYEDPNLRKVMTDFIAAWGKRYDGDPRLAYITAGMLGTWGEWHTYPKTELWASKEVQKEILDAFAAAFKSTPVLLRYPAGPRDSLYADSTGYSFGYHDDSFAHSTLDTGRSEDDWFFWPKMKKAGLTQRWKTSPIGGEIRPEVWGCCFDEPPCTAPTQSFDACRETTHVTWLMDTGMNREKADPKRYDRAIEAVQKMGYDIEVVSAEGEFNDKGLLDLRIAIANRGIAPFYHDGWNARLSLVHGSQVKHTIAPDWSPKGVLPGQRRVWSRTIALPKLSRGQYELQLAIPSPMKGGKPIRFANESSNKTTAAITIGTIDL